MSLNLATCPKCGQVAEPNKEYRIGEKRLLTLKCGHFVDLEQDSVDGIEAELDKHPASPIEGLALEIPSGGSVKRWSVELDDDVYGFIRANVRDFGESVSTVLRRLLQAPALGPATLDSKSGDTRPHVNGRPAEVSPSLGAESPLFRFVSDPSFRRGTATDRFLRTLGFVYKEDPTRFERVFEISGRSRKYFGRSEDEIEKSGTSTHPRQIPGSEYWAMTNADTRQKCDVLKTVLRSLGYAVEEIRAAVNAVS